MKKIIFLVLAAVLLVCASAGCIAEEDKELSDRYIPEYYNSCWIYIDKFTGVEYIVYSGGYDGGICPRYNADGTLKINEEFKK